MAAKERGLLFCCKRMPTCAAAQAALTEANRSAKPKPERSAVLRGNFYPLTTIDRSASSLGCRILCNSLLCLSAAGFCTKHSSVKKTEPPGRSCDPMALLLSKKINKREKDQYFIPIVFYETPAQCSFTARRALPAHRPCSPHSLHPPQWEPCRPVQDPALRPP